MLRDEASAAARRLVLPSPCAQGEGLGVRASCFRHLRTLPEWDNAMNTRQSEI